MTTNCTVNIKDLKPGQKLKADAGFTCLDLGVYEVQFDKRGPYIFCSEGKHYLDGQTNEDGNLVGLEAVS